MTDGQRCWNNGGLTLDSKRRLGQYVIAETHHDNPVFINKEVNL